MAPLDMMDLLKIYFAFKYRPPTNIKKTVPWTFTERLSLLYVGIPS